MRPAFVFSIALLAGASPCDPGQSADSPPDPVCLAACAAGESLSKTDQETCNLVCSAHPAAPTVPGQVIGRFDACLTSCPNDTETCGLNCCEATANAVGGASPALERDCLAPCLHRLLQCEGACARGHETSDRETCRLHCETDASSCLEECVKPPG